MANSDDFREDTYKLLDQLLKDASAGPDRQELLQRYTEQFSLMHSFYAHKVLDELLAETRTRLDARLAPDPLKQTVANVQTTFQDFLKNIFGQ